MQPERPVLQQLGEELRLVGQYSAHAYREYIVPSAKFLGRWAYRGAIFTEDNLQRNVVNPINIYRDKKIPAMTRGDYLRDAFFISMATAVPLVLGIHYLEGKKSKLPSDTGPAPIPSPDKTNKPVAVPIAKPSVEPAATPVEKILTEREQRLQKILSLPPFSPERKKLEVEYASQVKNLEDVEMGYRVLANIGPLQALRDFTWDQRTKGKENLTPLPQKEIEWAWANGIHPEVLTQCKETYYQTLDTMVKIMKDDQKKPSNLRFLRFKDNEQIPTNLTRDEDIRKYVEQFLINPGGMAMLMKTETAGAINIGSKIAWTQLKGSYIEDLPKLQTLIKDLNKTWNLSYDMNNITGSQGCPDDKEECDNLSGGALGFLQLMPGHALEMFQKLGSLGVGYSPWDLKSAIIGGYIHLAREKKAGNRPDPAGVSFGYKKGYPESIYYGLAKWNKHEPQIINVAYAANDYYDRFLDSKPTKRPHTKDVVVYSQRDKTNWGENWQTGETCGPTTIAGIMSTFGLKTTPAEIDSIFLKNKPPIRIPAGTVMRNNPDPQNYGGGVLDWMKKEKGFDVVQIHDSYQNDKNKQTFDLKRAKELLDDGYQIIYSGDVKYTNGNYVSHIVNLVDVMDLGDYHILVIADPWTGEVNFRRADEFSGKYTGLTYSYAVRPKK
jgi:hypothetical protein